MKRILGSTLALSLLFSGAALAAPDRDNDRGDRGRHQSQQQDHRQARHNNPPQYRSQHRNGQHLAMGHRGYRVADYNRYGLRAPPRGHEWRRVDNDYVMIAIATGLISSVLIGR